MIKKFVWLRTSLFIDRDKWNHVLKDGINTFLSASTNKIEISEWRLQFNYLGGENIRFAIKTDLQYCEQLASQIDNFFKIFFLKNVSSLKETELPSNRIFLPPPQSSIQYGLYVIPEAIDQDAEKMATNLSKYIIGALENEAIDEETLITLAFYFHVTLIMEFRKRNLHFMVSKTQVDNPIHHDQVVTESFLVEKFNESEVALKEIIKSINNINSDYDTLYWLKNWVNDCYELAKNSTKENYELVNNVRNQINHQLGLTPNMIKILYHFISQSSNWF